MKELDKSVEKIMITREEEVLGNWDSEILVKDLLKELENLNNDMPNATLYNAGDYFVATYDELETDEEYKERQRKIKRSENDEAAKKFEERIRLTKEIQAAESKAANLRNQLNDL